MGRRLAAAALAVAAFAHAAPAGAQPCDAITPFTQSRPSPENNEQLVTWYPRANAGLGVTQNATDDLARPAFDWQGHYDWGTPGGANECTRSAEELTVAYPYRADPLGSGALIAHKVYVPSTQIWARTITFARNPTDRPLSLSLWSAHRNPFGANSSVREDSSGNFAIDTGDIYGLFQSTVNQWRYSWIWQHSNPRRRASAAAVMAAGPGDPPPPGRALVDADTRMAVNWLLHLAPGETKAVMHYAVYGPSDGVSIPTQALAGGLSQEQFANMTPEDARAIVNWMVEPDADKDTVDNGQDNCLYAPNTDQANADLDSEIRNGRYYEGDACDDDDDDDGLSDADEAIRGSDPLKADTDGDGVLDPGDDCPRAAARGFPRGCPPALPSTDTKAPRLRLLSVPKSMRLRTLRARGLTCSAIANEPIGISCRLVGRIKGRANLSRAGEVELASGSVRRGSGRRQVRLRPRATMLRGIRRFTAYLVVTASDRSGNRSTQRRKILVR